MDAGIGVMIFMGLILKIPVAAACWLIWHAVRSEPEPASSEDTGGGSDRNQPHRDFRRKPRRPRDPRRGPHAPGALSVPCPENGGKLRVTRRPALARTSAGSAGTHRR